MQGKDGRAKGEARERAIEVVFAKDAGVGGRTERTDAATRMIRVIT